MRRSREAPSFPMHRGGVGSGHSRRSGQAMSGNHGNGHHPHPESSVSIRARALESLLIEKGLTSSEVVDEVISAYEQDVGPHNGAKVVARAWVDPAYKARLLADGTAAVAELGFGGALIAVAENTPSVHNLVVCTL